MQSSVARGRLRRAAPFAAALSLAVVAIFRYRIDSDETQHMHVAWNWARGLVGFRDFFDNHMPLFHILFAPLIGAVGSTPDIIYFARLPMLAIAAGTIAASWSLGRSIYDGRTALLAAWLLALCPPFLLLGVEFRNDTMQILFATLALATAFAGPFSTPRMFVAGLLSGCALATSMKEGVLLLSAGVAIVAFMSLRPRRVRSSDVRPLGAFAGGTLVVPALLAIYFASQRALGDFYYCVAAVNFAYDPGRLHVIAGRLLFVVSILLALLFRRSLQRATASTPAPRLLLRLYAASFVLLTFSFWPIIAVRDLAVILPVAAIELAAIIQHRCSVRGRRLAVASLLLVEIAFVFQQGVLWKDSTIPAWTLLHRIQHGTSEDDTVMDVKGEVVFRKRPTYRTLERVTRQAIARGKIHETMADDLVKSACFVVARDSDFYPPDLHAFIHGNYVEAGGLLIAGHAIDSTSSPESFPVAIAGLYTVAEKIPGVQLAIDGVRMTKPEFLAAGEHTIEVLDRAVPSEERLVVIWAPALSRGLSPFDMGPSHRAPLSAAIRNSSPTRLP